MSPIRCAAAAAICLMLIFAPPPPRARSTPVAPSLAATCAIDSPPRPPRAPKLPPRALSCPFRTTTELSTGRGLAACQLHLDRPGLKGPPDRPLAPALHPPLHRPINRLRSAERGDGTACLVRPCSDQQARPFCHRAPSHLLHALLLPPATSPCSPANAMNATSGVRLGLTRLTLNPACSHRTRSPLHHHLSCTPLHRCPCSSHGYHRRRRPCSTASHTGSF